MWQCVGQSRQDTTQLVAAIVVVLCSGESASGNEPMRPHTADYCPANLAVATASRASVRPTPTRSRLCATAAYEAISSLEYSAPVV